MPRHEDTPLPILSIAPEWKTKFAKFVFETPYRPKSLVKSTSTASPTPNASPDSDAPARPANLTDLVVRDRWITFIERLDADGKSVLVSHLQLCNIESFNNQTVKLRCSSKTTFEILLDELHLLADAAEKFYGSRIQFDVVLDKTVVAKQGKTPQEQFKELAEKSDLIKYLIEHFGAELSY